VWDTAWDHLSPSPLLLRACGDGTVGQTWYNAQRSQCSQLPSDGKLHTRECDAIWL